MPLGILKIDPSVLGALNKLPANAKVVDLSYHNYPEIDRNVYTAKIDCPTFPETEAGQDYPEVKAWFKDDVFVGWEVIPRPIIPEAEVMKFNPYEGIDKDTEMVLAKFDEPEGSTILEVGANEERLAQMLAAAGHKVVAIDLRDHHYPDSSYDFIKADFVEVAKYLSLFDCVVSTSAIEHFGLVVYGQNKYIEDYDAQACSAIWDLLVPGGTFYVTVPYGKEFLEDGDWRVYDRKSLEERIIGKFDVEECVFFKSGDCPGLPDTDGIVSFEDANTWSGKPPHLTSYLKLRKGEWQ